MLVIIGFIAFINPFGFTSAGIPIARIHTASASNKLVGVNMNEGLKSSLADRGYVIMQR